MSLLAIELNDAGLLLARTGADGTPVLVGQESPGLAVLHEGRVHVGSDAVRRYRLAPLHAQNRFWQALSVDALPWSAGGIATAADLAHAHLSAVLSPAVRGDASELLIAVPPGYTREQLGLLVGIASECGVTVRGLVDAALAACTTVAPAAHMLHLDLQLHQAAATLLETSRGEGTLRRVRYEFLPGAGVFALHQAMAAAIASSFVQETRFDPLHQAVTEQRLHDALPGWLQALAAQDEVNAEIELGATTHGIAVNKMQLAAAVEALSDDILRLVHAARPPGVALHLCFSPRIAAIPGLVARLAALRDCVVVELSEGAAASGALLAANAIARPVEAIALVHRLPLAGNQAQLSEPATSSFTVPADAVPTHVLFRGRAWPISAVPLTLGWSVAAVPRALALPAGVAGVSRSHCTLESRDGQAFVVDHSTYGTFVNDERVGERLQLKVGDVLRLGAPGVSLELIRVLPDHGAS